HLNGSHAFHLLPHLLDRAIICCNGEGIDGYFYFFLFNYDWLFIGYKFIFLRFFPFKQFTPKTFFILFLAIDFGDGRWFLVDRCGYWCGGKFLRFYDGTIP